MKYIVGTVAKCININTLFSEIILFRLTHSRGVVSAVYQLYGTTGPPKHGLAVIASVNPLFEWLESPHLPPDTGYPTRNGSFGRYLLVSKNLTHNLSPLTQSTGKVIG